MFSDTFMIVVVSIVLALFTLGPLLAIAAPRVQHDPQGGMAIGCLMIVALCGGLASGIFTIGVLSGWRWMLTTAFSVAAFILVLIIVNLVAWGMRSSRRLR